MSLFHAYVYVFIDSVVCLLSYVNICTCHVYFIDNLIYIRQWQRLNKVESVEMKRCVWMRAYACMCGQVTVTCVHMHVCVSGDGGLRAYACVCVWSGDGGSICGERGSRPPACGWAAQDSGGSGVQRDGRQGAELSHLHITHHSRRRRRPTRQLEAWRSADVCQRRGALTDLIYSCVLDSWRCVMYSSREICVLRVSNLLCVAVAPAEGGELPPYGCTERLVDS